MKTISRLAFCGIAWLGLLSGCGEEENYLEGSISKTFPIGFDYTKLDRTPETIVVRFQQDISFPDIQYQGVNTVLEFTLEQNPAKIVLGTWQDVSRSVRLARYVLYMENDQLVQDSREYPKIFSANMIFASLSEQPGAEVSGEFRITFVDGNTLRGGFTSRL